MIIHMCCTSNFRGKGDIRKCIFYGGVKLFVHRMKVVERVLEKKLLVIVTVRQTVL